MGWFRVGGLRLRLVVLVLLAALPALALTVYSGLEDRHEAIAEAKARVQMIARHASQMQRRYLDNARQILFTLSQLPQLKSRDAAATSAILAGLLKNTRMFPAFLATGPDGVVFASAPLRRKRISLADRPYFKRLLKTKRFVVGHYVLGRITGKASLVLAHPVKDAGGRLKAVIVTGVDLGWLDNFLTQMKLPPDTHLAVIDRYGRVLVHYPAHPGMIGRNVSNLAITKIILNRREGVVEAPGFEGVPRLFGFTSLGQNGAVYVLIGMSVKKAFAPLTRKMIRDTLLLALVGVLALLAAWFGGTFFMMRPVNHLIDVTEQVADGDLAARAGPPYGSGELGQLARSFDQMSQSLQLREEELEAANRELEAFTYSVSHDLRAPLRAMDGFSRILIEEHRDLLTDEPARYLGLIRDNAQQMDRLIDGLLTFSRLGRKRLKKQTVSPADLVDEAVAVLRPDQEGRRVEITNGDLPTCQADPELLKQVFVNLIGNALKFTRDREEARIEIGSQETDGERVYFVRDNGVGFDMQYEKKLFGVFQRLHRAEDYEGSGVGLALAQRIIHRHGGR
ncbi:MAG: HAMP domain-containing protein, partial [Proteobacteria bacterium]|nr:HAMP domain-containing protein [Pseudomonadota bacterium]